VGPRGRPPLGVRFFFRWGGPNVPRKNPGGGGGGNPPQCGLFLNLDPQGTAPLGICFPFSPHKGGKRKKRGDGGSFGRRPKPFWGAPGEPEFAVVLVFVLCFFGVPQWVFGGDPRGGPWGSGFHPPQREGGGGRKVWLVKFGGGGRPGGGTNPHPVKACFLAQGGFPQQGRGVGGGGGGKKTWGRGARKTGKGGAGGGGRGGGPTKGVWFTSPPQFFQREPGAPLGFWGETPLELVFFFFVFLSRGFFFWELSGRFFPKGGGCFFDIALFPPGKKGGTV